MTHTVAVERLEFAEAARPDQLAGRGPASEKQRPKILVVDDEEDIRLMLSDILGLHYRVETAVDGVDALERIAARGSDFDLVMTDLRMPHLDGSELTARILADYPDLGVIMMSAHGTITEAGGALKKGVFDYVTKPLPRDLKEVYHNCERYFQSRDLERAQTMMQEEIHNLSRFPRSNPHSVSRASVIDGDILLRSGNAKIASLFGVAAEGDTDEHGHYLYSQGRLEELFPRDYREILERINGTDEVIEVDRVSYGNRHFRHTYTPFVDNSCGNIREHDRHYATG